MREWVSNSKSILAKYTVVSPNSPIPSSHTYPSSHRFFGLTKMWLLGDTTVS